MGMSCFRSGPGRVRGPPESPLPTAGLPSVTVPPVPAESESARAAPLAGAAGATAGPVASATGCGAQWHWRRKRIVPARSPGEVAKSLVRGDSLKAGRFGFDFRGAFPYAGHCVAAVLTKDNSRTVCRDVGFLARGHLVKWRRGTILVRDAQGRKAIS